MSSPRSFPHVNIITSYKEGVHFAVENKPKVSIIGVLLTRLIWRFAVEKCIYNHTALCPA